MNPPTQKVVLLFFALVCIFLSIHSTEGKSLRRGRKSKSEVELSHIRSLEELNEGAYAQGYGYGEPVEEYALKKRTGKGLRSRKGKQKKVKVVAWNGRVKNYAKRYKTWAPSKEYLKGGQVYAGSESRPVKKRRRPSPTKVVEDFVPAGSKRRRKVRPHRGNAIHRHPPEEIIYDEYEEYFPDETKRQELDYEYSERPREKKRRKPESRKKPKKPAPTPKYPYEDERVLISDRYKLAPGEPTVSYSNFVQHPPPKKQELDYDYPEEEESRYIRTESQGTRSRKRKRVKKKSNNDRKREPEDLPIRQDDSDRYPPVYTIGNTYDGPQRVKSTSTRQTYDPNTIYGEGHISQQNNYNNRYQEPEIETIGNYGKTTSYNDGPNSPYSRPNSNSPTSLNPQNFNNQIYNSFEPQPNRFNQVDSRPYRDYSSPQTNLNKYNVQPQDFSGPGSSYRDPYSVKNNANQFETDFSPNPTFNTNFRPSSSFGSQGVSNHFPNQLTSGSNYQYSRQPTNSQYQTGFDSPYSKQSNSPYDSSETVYDFSNNNNGNIYANGQPSKNFGSAVDFLQKYRNNHLLSSLEKNDPENEFITKHQNLYNNGLNGVPVQGDGFGASRGSGKNDFDIGYGEFQFDENPTTAS